MKKQIISCLILLILFLTTICIVEWDFKANGISGISFVTTSILATIVYNIYSIVVKSQNSKPKGGYYGKCRR